MRMNRNCYLVESLICCARKPARTWLISLGALAALLAGSCTTAPSREPTAPPTRARNIPYGTNDAAAHRLRVGDAEIYYEIYGDGPPVLLLHGGFYGYIDGWAQYIAALSDRYKVIAMATRGHGRSSIGSAPFSRRLFADDAAAVLKHETDQPAIVIGFSDGATTAYMLAATYPDSVKKAVAIGSGLRTTQSSVEWARNLSPEGVEQELGSFVKARKQLMPEPERWNEFVGKYRAMFIQMMDGVSDEQAKGIACPVLVIGGDRDRFIPLNEFVRVRSLIRNSRLLILPDCDHVPSLRRPVVLREFVLPFVQE
jgi:pimeloyl-ACP methyl ester carboxylesterase